MHALLYMCMSIYAHSCVPMFSVFFSFSFSLSEHTNACLPHSLSEKLCFLLVHVYHLSHVFELGFILLLLIILP